MLSFVLVPVIKDKCDKINDSDNNRPIALASVISKIVEKVILDRMSSFLITIAITSLVSSVSLVLICLSLLFSL